MPEVERTEGLRLREPPAAAARSAEAWLIPPRGAGAALGCWALPSTLDALVLGVLIPKTPKPLRLEAVDEERRWRDGVGWVGPMI